MLIVTEHVMINHAPRVAPRTNRTNPLSYHWACTLFYVT